MSGRRRVPWFRGAIGVAVWLLFGPVLFGEEESPAPQEQAREIFEATGLEGGLVVHLGCGDGKLTAALRAGDGFLVQGLDADAENVRRAREHVQSLGLCGNVSVDRFEGERLPYVDNLVNLVVAEDLGGVPRIEVMRVLCPEGTAYVKQGGRWTRTVKPRPKEIDEWTHYLHDAGGNAVSQDAVVGPPRRFQWIGSPRWARHHDRMASMTAAVTSGGRLFYIFDEGSTASIMLPPRRTLIARDAFNGTILWKRPVSPWHPYLWPLKSGPAWLGRRLVAVGDEVYVTLGLDAPLTALDGATGKTLRTYEGSRATEEVIASEGVLFLLVHDAPPLYDDFKPEDVNIGQERDRVARDWPWDEKPRRILAVRADTGEVLWRHSSPVVPLTLAADGARVYFHDGERIVAWNRRTGQPEWRSSPVERRAGIPTSFGPTLVAYQDIVLFSGGTRSMSGLSAETGETLWNAEHPVSGHYSPEDLLVAGGLAWAGEIAGGRDSGIFTGRDVHTGEIKSQFAPDTDVFFMHHRCHRAKATDRYLIPSRTGTEFVDFRSEHWTTNHWVRGGCIYGIIPSNGLLYAPPHSCACYMEAKLNGFCALASAPSAGEPLPPAPDENRLQRGPAYGQVVDDQASSSDRPSDDWPTYRHDAGRSGFTPSPVPVDLKRAWQSELGGRLTSVVIAGGKVFVARVDAHTLHALDADSGEALWTFTAGGRIDSPPTIYEGRALFGSADGSVYCLRASDGALVWRFRAAPQDRRLVAFEQVESVWPVPGSVLVEDGVLYCVAGRSMFVDGGLRFLRLDPKTGRMLSETVLDERDPETGENLQAHVMGLNMPVGLPDVLSSDGRYVYMRSQVFDLEGNRGQIPPNSANSAKQAAVQEGETAHLFSPTGFLDDAWWHRSYWVYGRSFAQGAGGWPQAGKFAPGGRILVCDESSVYGYGRTPRYYQWRTPMEYHLFSASKEPEIVREPIGPKVEGGRQPRLQHPRYAWSHSVPLQARAMVLAADTLFLAGPPDVVDEEEAFARFGEPETSKKLAQQDEALRGKQGALVWAVSAGHGEKLAEHRLDTLPVFDGLAAAGGRLFLATTDGRVLCFAKQ